MMEQLPVNLIIRLRARHFYEVIVDEGEARINYRFIEIGSKYNVTKHCK